MPTTLPPEIARALQVLTGGGESGGQPSGGGGTNNPPVPFTRLPVGRPEMVPSPGQTTLPLLPRVDEEMVKKFLEAAAEGPEAVRRFTDLYGEQIDAATWSAILAAIPEEQYRTLGEKIIGKIRGHESYDEETTRANVEQGAMLSSAFIVPEDTTWDALTEDMIKWLRSDVGAATFGKTNQEDLDKLIERARAEGATATEIEDLQRSPIDLLAEQIANLDAGSLLEFNPELAGQEEIPAGSVIIFAPRAFTLEKGQSFEEGVREQGLDPDTVLAYQQRQAALRGERFDPDKLVPGQKIYRPPESFIQASEQTTPPGLRTTSTTSPNRPLPPDAEPPPSIPPVLPEPFLPGPYGEDYLAEIGLPLEDLTRMAADPGRSQELLSLLMQAQYGNAQMPGRFGDYLRGHSDELGRMVGLFDALGIGGGPSARDSGGAYSLFEDMYESLGAGPGTANPTGTSITDWRNLIYGGAGAPAQGGLLSGGPSAGALEPGTLPEAESYLARYVQPLLGSTVGSERWNVLANMLPGLWNEYSRQPRGDQLWLQWLVQQGYLPGVAR